MMSTYTMRLESRTRQKAGKRMRLNNAENMNDFIWSDLDLEFGFPDRKPDKMFDMYMVTSLFEKWVAIFIYYP